MRAATLPFALPANVSYATCSAVSEDGNAALSRRIRLAFFATIGTILSAVRMTCIQQHNALWEHPYAKAVGCMRQLSHSTLFKVISNHVVSFVSHKSQKICNVHSTIQNSIVSMPIVRIIDIKNRIVNSEVLSASQRGATFYTSYLTPPTLS